MELNVQVIASKCRLCTVDTLHTSFDIFSTWGLQLKIRKYLQITVKSSREICTNCDAITGKNNIAQSIDGIVVLGGVAVAGVSIGGQYCIVRYSTAV